MKKILLLSVLLLILFLFISCNQTENGMERIKVGFHTNYGGAGSLLVGQQKGFFEEVGLQVDMIPFSSGPPAIAAIKAGTIDFAYVGQGAHSLVVDGHARILLLQNISDAEAIIANKQSGIQSIQDLKGKTVAVMFGTSSEELLKVALVANGVVIDDVQIVNYDMNGAVSALAYNRVDAVCVWEQYKYEAIDSLGDDAVVLATTSDFNEEYVSLSSWVSHDHYIDTNEATVQKFVIAMLKAQNYWDKNTEEVCRIISQELEISLEALLRGQYLIDIFTIDDMREKIHDGTIEELYTIQQKYFLQNENIEKRQAINDYVFLNYMENAVEYLSE